MGHDLWGSPDSRGQPRTQRTANLRERLCWLAIIRSTSTPVSCARRSQHSTSRPGAS